MNLMSPISIYDFELSPLQIRYLMIKMGWENMSEFTKSYITQIVKSIVPKLFLKELKIIECSGTVLIKVELALWIMLVPVLWFVWWWYRKKIEKRIEEVRSAGVRVVVSVD